MMTTSPSTSLSGTVFKVSSLSGLAMVLFWGSDLWVASRLGVSAAADAFFVASTVPMVLIGLCTAIGAALVPVFVPVQSRLPAKDESLYATAFNVILMALLALVALGVLLAPMLVAVISPGVNEVTAQLATVLLRIILPTALFSGLAAILMGMLNAHEQFAYAALSNLVRAAGTLGGVAVFSGYGAVGVSVGWVLGGLIQLIVTMGICRWRMVFRYQFYLNRRASSLGEAWTLARTALFGVGIFQVAVVLEKVIASFLPAGTISAFSYATRIVRAGSLVVVTTVAQVTVPALTAKHTQNLLDEAHRLFIRTFQFTVYLTFPAAAVLISLSLPLNTLLLQRGAMTAIQVSKIASLFSLASIGLIFFSFYELSLAGLYAQCRTRSINLFYTIFLGGFVLWSVLIGRYGKGKGLALVYPLSLLMSALYGLWALKIPRSYWATTRTHIIRLAVAALAMGSSTFGITTIVKPMLETLPTVARAALVLMAGLMTAGIVWIGTTTLMKVPETLERMQRVWGWVCSRV
jgi:putative peptidoglycan lipid II flippase